LKSNYGKQKQKQTKWLENWKPEFLYGIIFIIDQIKTYVTILMAFGMYVELNKHIY